MTTAGQAALFELDDERDQTPGPHVLLPNMGYACGGSILAKAGGFMFLSLTNFAEIGCPDCREIGHDALLEEQRTQQGRQADVS